MPKIKNLLEALSIAQRKKLPSGDYVFPDRAPDGGWPINDLKHAKIALEWARKGFRVEKGSADAKKIVATVLKRYPQLKESASASMFPNPRSYSKEFWVAYVRIAREGLGTERVTEGPFRSFDAAQAAGKRIKKQQRGFARNIEITNKRPFRSSSVVEANLEEIARGQVKFKSGDRIKVVKTGLKGTYEVIKRIPKGRTLEIVRVNAGPNRNQMIVRSVDDPGKYFKISEDRDMDKVKPA